ncbi:NCS2 family permease [Selenomonas sputigena]|uniref:Putative permease n=1 Tax=Selenomonas sputigena (strain ATCC 35185 / DSM 20758 / CCUG 44933 / VPI D19B-28) TaxID=546271 RepID=C9LXW9_SELS3|nr:NCS2 family permease [Selenomonas sputigena]AEB99342.1 Xanthine/uracil/vitamin C permease [Selenomonas sputigena ATCC 35185]EEX76502.1 putative permease [Selenomonas sputigena ATCC 35185]
MEKMLENVFHLKENRTTVQTELLAGLTTFMTMAYILAVNPLILSAAGMDAGAVFTATALASGISCVLMASFANLPFALSSAMGLNAFFAYTVVGQMGYSWQLALTAVLVEGLIFIALSVTNVREALFNAIPLTLKSAVTVGIGFFITFIGLQNAHVVVAGPKLVALFSFPKAMAEGTFHSEGITVLLALFGILLTAVLVIKNLKGHILIGIFATWGLGIVLELLGVYIPDPARGYFSLMPTGIVAPPVSLAPTFLQFDFHAILSLDFIVVIFAFLFVDLFDTLGTLIGCASRADMLDEKGRLPRVKGALLADACGTSLGACLGTSTISTYVESSAGIVEGGRTGLTAVTTAIFFLVALFFSPLFLAVPGFATAPALVIVGFLMMQQVAKIPWSDITEAIPSFICIAVMPFAYSIAEGIAFGIISYTLLHVASGKFRNVTWLMYVLTVLFILKYAWL